MLDKQLVPASEPNLSLSLKEFKVPLPRPSKTARAALRQKPLEEEIYTSSLQRIVERDYFPELPFLRAKQALDDAIQTRDPQRIKAAYAAVRKCSKTPTFGRKLATPRSSGLSTGRLTAPATPRSSFSTETDVRDGSSTIMDEKNVEEDAVEKLVQGKSLDQFTARYTSEDNYSASEIMLKDAEQLEKNRMWIHEHSAEYNLRQQLLVKYGPRQDHGTLNMYLSAPYDEKQSLMHYVPETEYASKLSTEESRRPPKGISPAATRFGKAFLSTQDGAVMQAAVAHMRASSEVPESPKVNGFGFVCTPSPCPGVDDDPIFTWGSVEGTPLLLADDNISGFNPFKVQEQSVRERISADLGKKSCGVKKTIAKADARSRPRTPGTQRLSEAARKLARKTLGSLADGMSADPQLRASYRRSTPRLSERGPTPRTPVTPRCAVPTPTGARGGAQTPRRPESASGASAGQGCSKHLTDGLLEL